MHTDTTSGGMHALGERPAGSAGESEVGDQETTVKRDPDLVRKMLLAVEEAPTGFAPTLSFEGYTDAQVGYHAYLLIDAGLAKGPDVTAHEDDGPVAVLQYLTWEGHEFADAARDETRWKKAKSIVAEKGGGVTFDVMKALLISLAKTALGLS